MVAHRALDFEAGSSLDQLQAASVNYRIAIGPHAGRKALTLYSVPPMEERSNLPLVAKMAGFSLHARTVCEAYQRSRLERLCRYITRSLIATKRLSQFPFWPLTELSGLFHCTSVVQFTAELGRVICA